MGSWFVEIRKTTTHSRLAWLRGVERPVRVHDLHATLLHALGLNHTRLRG